MNERLLQLTATPCSAEYLADVLRMPLDEVKQALAARRDARPEPARGAPGGALPAPGTLYRAGVVRDRKSVV